MWRWFCLVQLAGADRPPVSADLKLVPPPCAAASGDEIVVCRARLPTDRYGPRLPDAVEPMLPQAEGAVFGAVRAGVAARQRSAGGIPLPPAVTVTVRMPF
ncbi:MAG: hypothetical protein ABW173_01135 [Sphingomonas sp.]